MRDSATAAAVEHPEVAARGWANIICVASGPSLTVEQCELIEAARNAYRVLVVNRTWERLPNADLLYACDGKFWDEYMPAVRAGFRGELWTQDRKAADKYGLHYVRSKGGNPGLSRDPSVIHTGGNGGYQLLGLAYHFGARKIVLAGYDMQHANGKAHWHPDYPKKFGNATAPESWVPRFTALAKDLESEGVLVLNATASTALTCFLRADLAEVLR